MIETLKRYAEYKHSGLPWLGQVPITWEVSRLKTHARNIVEQTSDYAPGSLYLGLEHVESWTGRIREAAEHVVFDSQVKRFRQGDVLFGKLRPYLAKVTRPERAGVCVGEFLVLRAEGRLRNDFLEQILRCKPIVDAIDSSTFGAKMPRADWNFVGGLGLCFPPVGEQIAIVKFLNHFDKRIRRYIAAKKKLIALLNEQKQAIIHRAVTRGLDPNVRLKPSGVPWIPEMPAHWRLCRLKFEASHIVDCLHATPHYSPDGEYPAIRTADVEPGKLRLSKARKVSADQFALWTSRLAPRVGDILYSREGERFGMAALVPDGVRLCISQRMMAVRTKPEHNSEYLMWELNCPHVYAQAAADLIGATSPHVNVEKIKNYILVIPPRNEQDAIVEYIRLHTGGITTAVAAFEQGLALIREYRTRLIADVVTGKLDVREAAASLPEEPAEAEPFEEIEEESGESGEVENGSVTKEAEV